jgi:membrane-associated phospholipid phosphatase
LNLQTSRESNEDALVCTISGIIPKDQAVGTESLAFPPISGRLDGAGTSESLQRAVRAAQRACGAFEWVTFGYFGFLNAAIAIFARDLPHASWYIALHTAIAGSILMLCIAADRLSRSPEAARSWLGATVQWVRLWYPQALFLFCFEELGRLVHLVFPQWFDRYLIAFDHALTGVHPSVWLGQFSQPVLNDVIQMAYISYFVYLTIVGAALERQGQRRAFWAVMTSSIAAYVVGYIISIFFPIESPWFALASLQHGVLSGGPFTALIYLIESLGRVRGAAFPSAHVSGSTVALLGAWRYDRKLFWWLLPFYLGMLFSTVYGRYHYVADVFAGIAVGFVGFWAGHRLMRCQGALPGELREEEN